MLNSDLSSRTHAPSFVIQERKINKNTHGVKDQYLFHSYVNDYTCFCQIYIGWLFCETHWSVFHLKGPGAQASIFFS